MSNFKFSKVMLGISPSLAKETIISKIVGMVDVFRINLGEGFDDNNKKFIDTVMKLDNSKTMMLETKGNEIRIRNLTELKFKKGDKVLVEYSEYTQENSNRLYMDYPYIGSLRKGSIIKLLQSNMQLKVESIQSKSNIECRVQEGGKILPHDRVEIPGIDIVSPEILSEKDKKDILRGLEQGIDMLCVSSVKSAVDIGYVRAFLSQNKKSDMKILAKIENTEALDNIKSLLDVTDGLIIIIDQIMDHIVSQKIDLGKLIKKLRYLGKPISIGYYDTVANKDYPLLDEDILKTYSDIGVDSYYIGTIIQDHEVFDTVHAINKHINKHQNSISTKLKKFSAMPSTNIVRDYIIYNAYRISMEIEIKAIVCFTDNGYTPAKLVSREPNVPVITFTKKEETYKYLNTIRGVKGYKISPNFNYENLKKIGKEMIRIIFKGNISLEDKILIVQANEFQTDERNDMINGLELYAFKNI